MADRRAQQDVSWRRRMGVAARGEEQEAQVEASVGPHSVYYYQPPVALTQENNNEKRKEEEKSKSWWQWW